MVKVRYRFSSLLVPLRKKELKKKKAAKKAAQKKFGYRYANFPYAGVGFNLKGSRFRKRPGWED